MILSPPGGTTTTPPRRLKKIPWTRSEGPPRICGNYIFLLKICFSLRVSIIGVWGNCTIGAPKREIEFTIRKRKPPAELLLQTQNLPSNVAPPPPAPRGDGMEGFVFVWSGRFFGRSKSKENQRKWKEPNPLKNAFKNQFKMIEFPGQIYGCGSHDENVFVFFGAWGLLWMAWCEIHWIFMEI